MENTENKKKTVEQLIIENLKRVHPQALAEHEFDFCGTNCSGVSRTLRKMHEKGKVIGRRRYDSLKGEYKRFKEWILCEDQMSLF